MKPSLQFLFVVLCCLDVTLCRGFFRLGGGGGGGGGGRGGKGGGGFQRNCPFPIPDLISKSNLQGVAFTPAKTVSSKPTGYGTPRGVGVPVCPSTTWLLTDLEVDVTVGKGYAKRTQREECWVDKDQHILFAKCTTTNCESCDSYYQKKCVPVSVQRTFYAICIPARRGRGGSATASFVGLIRPKSGVQGFASAAGGLRSGPTGYGRRESGYGSVNSGYGAGSSGVSGGSSGYGGVGGARRDAGAGAGVMGKIRKLTVNIPSACQCQVIKCDGNNTGGRSGGGSHGAFY